MAHMELDLRERRAIEDMLNAKIPVSRIAAENRVRVLSQVQRGQITGGHH